MRLRAGDLAAEPQSATGWRGGYDAIVVGLGDQPLVPVDTWQTIAPERWPRWCPPWMDGHRSPPMRIGKELWPLLPTDRGRRRPVLDPK